MTNMIEIPEGYEHVLLTAIILSMECLLVGFIAAGKKRASIFSHEYLKENFGSQHQEAFGEEIKKGGYPDTGSGVYASKLSYKDWYLFNSSQRAHMNFVEMIASSLMFLLVAGLYCPCMATGFGVLMIVSRIFYSVGYVNSGPKGRLVGALLNDIAILGLFIMSMIFLVNKIRGNSGCSHGNNEGIKNQEM